VLERLEEDLHLGTVKPLRIATPTDMEDWRAVVRLVRQPHRQDCAIPSDAATSTTVRPEATKARA